MKFFLTERTYSSRKHAILTLFHSIELLLKEYLYRINPILIYKNIDKPITEDSLTVGISDLLIRLENLNLGMPLEQKEIIKNIQKRRNRIEHHRYDKVDEDERVIAESLKLILHFVEFFLNERLEDDVDPDTLREIQRLVFEYNELLSLANYRLEQWIKKQWPSWDPEKLDSPEEFEGTLDCPECRQCYLVISDTDQPFCFWCNTKIDAEECEDCGTVFIAGVGHRCY